MTNPTVSRFFAAGLLFFFTSYTQPAEVNVSGTLQQWHPVTITFDGLHVDESSIQNPFLDYRLSVNFTHAAPGHPCTGRRSLRLFQPRQSYVVYLLDGGNVRLSLLEGTYDVHWYNPRTGGELQQGAIEQVIGPGSANLGNPPAAPDRDWVVLLQKAK